MSPKDCKLGTLLCLPHACSTTASSYLCDFLPVQVSDKGLLYLQGLVQLKKLALQGTHVTSTSMPMVATFSELQVLDVAWTAIDSQGALMTLLESLHLCGTTKLLSGYLQSQSQTPEHQFSLGITARGSTSTFHSGSLCSEQSCHVLPM